MGFDGRDTTYFKGDWWPETTAQLARPEPTFTLARPSWGALSEVVETPWQDYGATRRAWQKLTKSDRQSITEYEEAVHENRRYDEGLFRLSTDRHVNRWDAVRQCWQWHPVTDADIAAWKAKFNSAVPLARAAE